MCAQQLRFFYVPTLFWRTMVYIVPWPATEHALKKMAATLLTRGVVWFDSKFNVGSFIMSLDDCWETCGGICRSLWSDSFVINQYRY